ncbi:GNAT family N-acetyltransferase [Nocardioides rotundus]|uniref:GNAT family N-acetyltransferase n=1 Tax=Nocardioides rotundus TaxID=1774216 RepID=UPI001CBF818C|nr:GNAT family N-acetyltransferase [Nocardioides rotundus]UAL29397.1 GNAT family N-acetyltransferase [Nocardioides rotundus]
MTPTVADRGFEELTSREAYALWRLRQDVFVVEQASPYPDLDGRDLDPTTRHLTVHDDDRLAGCLRLVDDGDVLRIGRVAVAASHRGRGVAAALMDAAMARVGDRPCRLDAQTYLVGFYASYGFAVDGPEFVEDGVPHLPMAR